MAEFVIGGIAVTLWLAWRDPGLLKERMAGPFHKGQVFWDKVFTGFIIVVWFSWLVLMALDAKRWEFSHMPDALKVVGAVLIPVGFFIVWLTFRENSFAAPVIKIQKERGQHVISTGPYAIVRHPMYAGGALYMIGMPLLLGSGLGLLILPLLLGALSVRIHRGGYLAQRPSRLRRIYQACSLSACPRRVVKSVLPMALFRTSHLLRRIPAFG